MRQEDIERMLVDDTAITPSPGFMASVMTAVEREAALPRPVRFPWRMVLPGLLAVIAALGAALWYGTGLSGDVRDVAALGAQLRQLMALGAGIGLQWIMLAIAVTIIATWVPSRLMRVPLRSRTRASVQ